MANPLFVATDLTQYAYSIANGGGSAAGYPVSNLNNYIASSIWKGSNTVAYQGILIDFGVAVSCSVLIVGNHNLWSLGCSDIYLQAADDSSMSINVVTLLGLTPLNNGDIYAPFVSTSRRYWFL